jgi:hypothetical protein
VAELVDALDSGCVQYLSELPEMIVSEEEQVNNFLPFLLLKSTEANQVKPMIREGCFLGSVSQMLPMGLE